MYSNCKYYTDVEFNSWDKLDLAGFSFVHFNDRYLNANFNSIMKFLQTLAIYFAIIAISETWANECTTETENSQVFNKVRDHKKGGGVAIYVKSSIQCS